MKKSLLKNQKGMTLVELIIACSILMLISGASSILLIRVYSFNKDVIARGLNNSNLQIAVSSFTKNVREAKQSDSGGYLILSGNDFDLKFNSVIDNELVTEKIHYFLENGYLKLGISNPVGNPAVYPEDDDEVKNIAHGIINESDEPIFYYYSGDDINDLENHPLTTPIIPDDVGLIKLYLITNINPSSPSSTDMEIRTFVRPRNID